VSGVAERRLRRAAGAAMLVGAVGAFVVLLAVNGLLTAPGTTRPVARAGLADTAIRAGSSTAAVGTARTAGAAHRPSPHAAVSREPSMRSPHGGVPTSTIARLAVSAEAGLQPTDDPEFGFER
jgi:hypothetical protein